MVAGNGGADVSEGYKAPNGFYNVYNSYSGSNYINSNSKAKKWISWANQYSSSTYENIKSVSYMLDTTTWTNKYGDNNFADYVIGGSTLEMFVASWNTKYPKSKIYCDAKDENGYNIGNTSGAETNRTNIATSYNIYVKPYTSKAKGFWLASPARGDDYNGYYVARVYYDDSVPYDGVYHGYVDCCDYYGDSTDFGFRPIVCLSSNVKLVSNGNGTYKLQK